MMRNYAYGKFLVARFFCRARINFQNLSWPIYRDKNFFDITRKSARDVNEDLRWWDV
jgi:hypothetical protein